MLQLREGEGEEEGEGGGSTPLKTTTVCPTHRRYLERCHHNCNHLCGDHVLELGQYMI